MCVAVPSKIVELNDMLAVVEVLGARRDVNLMLLPEEVGMGDYVLVHAGFAIQKVDTGAAENSLEFIREILAAEDEGRPYNLPPLVPPEGPD